VQGTFENHTLTGISTDAAGGIHRESGPKNNWMFAAGRDTVCPFTIGCVLTRQLFFK